MQRRDPCRPPRRAHRGRFAPTDPLDLRTSDQRAGAENEIGIASAKREKQARAGTALGRPRNHRARVPDSPTTTTPGPLVTNRRMADGESAPLMMAAYSGGSRQLRCTRRRGSFSICNWANALSAERKRRRARTRKIEDTTTAAIAATERISKRRSMRIVNDPQELAKPVQRCFADPCPILARILPADASREEEDTAHRQGFGVKTPGRIIGSAGKP